MATTVSFLRPKPYYSRTEARVRCWTNLARNRTGASALEFALVVPLFVALMLGVVDLGRYLLTQHELDSLASATARAVVVNCGQAGSHYGKLSGDCASSTYGLTDTQKHNTAPFIYGTGQTPSIGISCGANTCPTAGHITITASLATFTFFLPVAGIIPGWSSAAAEKSMTSALSQTATLYY
jgi:TadE-like protein